MRRLAGVLVLQAGWFACVLGAAHDREWLGCALAVALLTLRLALHPAPGAQARLALVVTALGWAADSALMAAGWIRYEGWRPLGILAPLWIASLWALFSTSLGDSLDWLARRHRTAFVLGATGGSLSYVGAERLGAVALGPARAVALAGLGLTWGLVLPVLVDLAARLSPPRTDSPDSGGNGRAPTP